MIHARLDSPASGRVLLSFAGALLGHPAATFVAIRVTVLLGTAGTLLWLQSETNPRIAYGAYDGLTDYIFGAFAQWDSNWYLNVAGDGYTSQSAAFLPLYPALVYALGAAIGSNLVAGVILSLVGGAVTARAMVEIARPLLGDARLRRTPPFCSRSIRPRSCSRRRTRKRLPRVRHDVVLAAQRGRPWLAGLLGAFAVGTRLMGIALVPALVALLWPKTRGEIPRLAPVILLPLMGLTAVALTFDLAVGDALAFSHAQELWMRDTSWLGPLAGIWEALVELKNSAAAWISLPRRTGIESAIRTEEFWPNQTSVWNTVDLLALVVAVALTVVAYRQLGLAFALYSAVLLAIATSAPADHIPLRSMVRFVMTDFPVLIAGAALLSGRPALRTGALVTLGALSAIAGAAFARGAWVT